MRESIYKAVAFFFGALIGGMFWCRDLCMRSIAFVAAVISVVLTLPIRATQATARLILHLIDGDRYTHQAALAGQLGELSELDILIQASKVKEDALRSGRWTLGHTIALNRVTFMLQARFGWEPERVVTYMKELVKEIPGVECEAAGEDSDQD